MELLHKSRSFTGQLIYSSLPPKDLYMCAAPTLRQLVPSIQPRSANFGLFIVMDAKGLSVDEIYEPAMELLQKGLAYMCAWGDDCGRVHDIFDEAEVNGPIFHGMPERPPKEYLMTTWHENDTLDEAVGFFVEHAIPAAALANTTSDWIFAAIGNSDYERRIRESVARS